MLLKEYIKEVIQEGMFPAPPKMVEDISNWAIGEWNQYKKDSRQGTRFGLNIEKEFPIDLEGWKYGNVLDDFIQKSHTDESDLIKYVRDLVKKRREEGHVVSKEQEDEFINSVQAGLTIGNNNLGKIKVVMKLTSDQAVGASWQEAAKTLFIYPTAYTKDEDIRRFVEHELIHVGQTILSKVKGAQAGVPFQKRGKETEHDLEDIEFYTVLNDEIHDAQKQGADARTFINKSRFFNLLKRNDMDKFRKAVRELTKALTK